MKKFILLFGGVLLMSSFTVTPLKISEDTELKSWTYHCNDATGKTGTFFMPATSIQAEAEAVTKKLCAAN